jgi:hypothetical protein
MRNSLDDITAIFMDGQRPKLTQSSGGLWVNRVAQLKMTPVTNVSKVMFVVMAI